MSGNQQYQEGIKHFNRKNYTEALRFFNNALLIDPENTIYLFAKARANTQLEKYIEALIDFEQALIGEPRNANIHSEKGVTLFHLNRWEESLASMDKAQEIEPDNPYRYASRAYIRAKSGDLFGAIEDYKIAIRLDPQDAVALNNLGMLQEQMGYQKDAKKQFKKADDIAERSGMNQPFKKVVEEARKNITPISKEDFDKLFTKKNGTTQKINGNTSQNLKNQHTNGQIKQVRTEKVKPTFKAYLQIILSVFRSKESFRDFLKFVKNFGKKENHPKNK